MKVKIDIAILMDQFSRKARCFKLKIDDSANICSDTKISEFLSISLDQYKQRMKNVCTTCEDNYGLWIGDSNLSDEDAIKKFKEEFSTELTLLIIADDI